MGGVPRNEPSRTGMRTDGLVSIPGNSCAACNTALDAEGGLLTCAADIDIIESLEGEVVSLSPFTLKPH